MYSLVRAMALCGLLMAQASAELTPVETLLVEIRDQTAETNRFLGTKALHTWQARLERLGKDAPRETVVKTMHELGTAQLRLGMEKQAVDQLGYSVKLARESNLSKEVQGDGLYLLGLAYLRFGETENCCRRHAPESCILPLQGQALHTRQQGSRSAMVAFERVLRTLPPSHPRYHAARWLLNLAAMTVDAYPDEVPKPHRVLPERMARTDKFPRFRNIAPQSGLATFSNAGGAVTDDFNRDGYLDIFVTNWDTAEAATLFLNNQDGTFRKVQEEAGLEGQLGGLHVTQTDYNNDGHLDVLILRGAWLGENGRHPNSLLRNDGPNREGIPHFTDVTTEMGLADVHYPTQTADWADYDLDGDLDLFIGNETTAAIHAPCQLFRNDGDRFVDVAKGAGVENGLFTKGVAWGDVDGDRYPDLYLANMDQPNRYYRNRGDGTFEDSTNKLSLAEPNRSFPMWFWDADNNGRLDLFIPFYSPDAGLTGSYYFGYQLRDEHRPGFYLNQGSNSLTNAAKNSNIELPTMPMGCNFGDLNNDGWLDFYLGTGDTDLENLTPNLMFLNRDGKSFENVTFGGGLGHLQKGHSIAFADLDNDGDLDIFAQMGGAYPVDRYYDALFENPGFGNNWLAIQLVGKESPRCAIGTRIHARFIDNGTQRSVYRHVDTGSSFGSNPLRQWIGLNSSEKVETLEIFWPVTNKTQRFENVEANRTIRIHEGSDAIEVLALKQYKIGKS